MANKIGLYLHIPFCRQKCAYCDFYSAKADESEYDRYTAALTERIKAWGTEADETLGSVYFGGGTPSVLGDERLCAILSTVKTCFRVADDAEITVELNPESGKALDFQRLRQAGFNRISVGLQTSNRKELQTLGRLHSPGEAALTVRRARDAGFANISMDVMLAIPFQTKSSLKATLDFCEECGVNHISAYLLKIETGTPFDSLKEQLPLSDEDAQAELYLYTAAYLESLGYRQYEISNFSFPGFESRHNTLYWQCGEYIGIGPAAHSFYHGRRFYCPRDMRAFYEDQKIDDGAGGDEKEYIMLALRLRSGLCYDTYQQRFNAPVPHAARQKINRYASLGFMEADETHACFTPKGFLVSNTILSDILSW